MFLRITSFFCCREERNYKSHLRKVCRQKISQMPVLTSGPCSSRHGHCGCCGCHHGRRRRGCRRRPCGCRRRPCGPGCHQGSRRGPACQEGSTSHPNSHGAKHAGVLISGNPDVCRWNECGCCEPPLPGSEPPLPGSEPPLPGLEPPLHGSEPPLPGSNAPLGPVSRCCWLPSCPQKTPRICPRRAEDWHTDHEDSNSGKLPESPMDEK